jgi:uncharacterized protein
MQSWEYEPRGRPDGLLLMTPFMEFDTFSVVLLEAGPNRAPLDEREGNALQDAHMAHLAKLHASGKLQAAGPILDDPSRILRGVCLHALPATEVRSLFEEDPLVRAGRLSVRILTWAVPKGAVRFSPTRFPQARAEL